MPQLTRIAKNLHKNSIAHFSTYSSGNRITSTFFFRELRKGHIIKQIIQEKNLPRQNFPNGNTCLITLKEILFQTYIKEIDRFY